MALKQRNNGFEMAMSFYNPIKTAFAILAVLVALVIQFRPLFWRLPPSLSSLAATGASLDYLHLIPAQIHTLNPLLYTNDYTVTHVTPLYPLFWRKVSGFLSFTVFRNAILGNWFLSCMALFVVVSGMAALTYVVTNDLLTMGLSVLFLLAGHTDPTGQYFLAMGDLAVPHEQALSLFPWILFFPVLRTQKRTSWPWEILIVALAANIHTPTAIYMTLSLIGIYFLIPQSRPAATGRSIFMALAGISLALYGGLPGLIYLRQWQPPTADFFSKAYWFLYPVSKLLPLWLRFFETAIFLSRWPLILFGFWVLARPWLKRVENTSSRVLFIASIPLTFLSLGRMLALVLPFSPSLIMAEFRAFMPAIVPLIPLASDFWKPLENRNRNLLILILGFFILARSIAFSDWGAPKSYGPWGKSATEVALAAKKLIPEKNLVLVPAQLMTFRLLSERATFGDFRGIEMLLSFDRTMEDFYLPVYAKLNFSYRHHDWPLFKKTASLLRANYAVLPASWNPCRESSRTKSLKGKFPTDSNCQILYKNTDLSIIDLCLEKDKKINEK